MMAFITDRDGPSTPPLVAPPGVATLIGWRLAAEYWHAHHASADRCSRYVTDAPCPTWRFADWFLRGLLPPPDTVLSSRRATVRAPH